MPPKPKFSTEAIIQTALEIVRQDGTDALTARAVASKLGSSPKVIFGLFSGMDDLRAAVFTAAQSLYNRSILQAIGQREYPPFKASGMAYIRFARQEPQLFRWLFMRDRFGEPPQAGEEYETILSLIMQDNACSRSQAQLLHFEMWTCVHGLASMIATGYQLPDEALISRVLTDVYQGVRKRITEAE